MLVQFSTPFRGRLPFRIRDCQSTYLSHLCSDGTKVSKYSMRVRTLTCFLDTNGRDRVTFRLLLLA